ncbi:Galactose mutarotase [Frankliniella fusca]|uniref:Galactose mutarotase n=1 Tax=Frankliniella fusca TaxID=407009 RepID=A0AAE1LIP3_9NEOP|nr:Galactose mutarotase [Frankliniella fusca]
MVCIYLQKSIHGKSEVWDSQTRVWKREIISRLLLGARPFSQVKPGKRLFSRLYLGKNHRFQPLTWEAVGKRLFPRLRDLPTASQVKSGKEALPRFCLGKGPRAQEKSGNNFPFPDSSLETQKSTWESQTSDLPCSGELNASKPPMIGKAGAKYIKHGAFCLETQNFPDAIHNVSILVKSEGRFPNSVLRPGVLYKHNMVFKFGVRI